MTTTSSSAGPPDTEPPELDASAVPELLVADASALALLHRRHPGRGRVVSGLPARRLMSQRFKAVRTDQELTDSPVSHRYDGHQVQPRQAAARMTREDGEGGGH